MEIRPPQTGHRCARFGASVAPAGAVVFHRYLQQVNDEPRINPAEPVRHARQPIVDTFESSSCPTTEPADSAESVDTGLAKLGEVLPLPEQPAAVPETRIVFQQRTPITGRLVDILA